jgi:hypothetical protein
MQRNKLSILKKELKIKFPEHPSNAQNQTSWQKEKKKNSIKASQNTAGLLLCATEDHVHTCNYQLGGWWAPPSVVSMPDATTVLTRAISMAMGGHAPSQTIPPHLFPNHENRSSCPLRTTPHLRGREISLFEPVIEAREVQDWLVGCLVVSSGRRLRSFCRPTPRPPFLLSHTSAPIMMVGWWWWVWS